MRLMTLTLLICTTACLPETHSKEDEDQRAATVFSNFIDSRDKIYPAYGNHPPKKGQSRIDPTTGAKITRLTDAADLEGTDDALIVYSRYSPENTNGQYFLAFGSNSTSAWVIDRITGQVIHKLQHINSREIGEAHEIRWDLSEKHPNRIYYRYGLSLYMIDDVSAGPLQHTLVKDFTGLVPTASTKLYNDVEGDSSNDSDHWAFMAAHYNGTTYVVDALVHYQISTDQTHILTPADLEGTNMAVWSKNSTFPRRPNMVEVSPLGTGIIVHTQRAYGEYSELEDTWFDGPHLWPLDFNVKNQAPIKVSISDTHSGWAFDDNGKELFISQNNRTDQLDAVYLKGAEAGYDNRIEIAAHDDFGWSNGFHYGKMPEHKPGWIFINTYSSKSSQEQEWAANQFIMMELKDEVLSPKIWRISPNYNLYPPKSYRDEAPAAINYLGNRIYVSANWGGELPNREVFLFELPDDWQSKL